MRLKIIIISLFLQLSLLSCSTRRREGYNVINGFLEDKIFESFKLNISTNKKDTVFLINEPFNVDYIKSYNLNFNLNKRFNSSVIIVWKDINVTIDLNQVDVAEMRSQMDKLIIEKWIQRKIKNKNIFVAPQECVFKKDVYGYLMPTKSRGIFIRLGHPVFNKNQDIAVFVASLMYNPNNKIDTSLLIMKKEKGKWVYVGSEYYNIM